MASTENSYPSRPLHHQRSKSNVLKSFMHRRDDSDASVIQPTEIYNTSNSNYEPSTRQDMGFPNFSRHNALGEIQQNHIDIASRSPRKTSDTPSSPTKTGTFASMKSMMGKEKSNTEKSSRMMDPPESPTKPKKTKSATNLAGLFSKPKSLKGMYRFGGDDEMRPRKDKENRTPPSSMGTPQEIARPPIYAQFASGALEKMVGPTSNSNDVFSSRYSGGHRSSNGSGSDMSSGYKAKPRPQSYHVAYTSKQPESSSRQASDHRSGSGSTSPSKISRGLQLFGGGSAAGSKGSQTQSSQSSESPLDPKDIDKHLEAMLDRRNIPEHQRYKMRNLANTIKMEFIRQDYAESRGLAHYRPGSHDSDLSMTSGGGPGANNNNGSNNNSNSNNNSGAGAGAKAAKKSRTRSFTLSRGKKSEPNSPTKKQKGEGSLGRHFRSKSTESVNSTTGGEQSSSSFGGGGGGSSGSGGGSGILSKIKLQQGPVDYVNYLRKVQKPESVEVGKLHKLRLLLRNETVAWTEEFIRQGGMQEIVGLLHRIMDVEWREEHEDALLHENLLCLKALCTTALALQYLHSIQGTLFPALLRMLFDPDKKGPSEFTTRGIITSVLFTYIQSASPHDRPIRARTVLAHLRDPEPKDEDRPLGFVMEMRRDRPYRVWCKEAVGVTKEVFWIFLHHLNVVYLPRDKEREQKQQEQKQRRLSSLSSPFDDHGHDNDNNVTVHESQDPKNPSGGSGGAAASDAMDDLAYMRLHFPQERPPVPAAPYVGGVEWDATNYLASHLDLLNAILACTSGGRAERNALREALRVSGWERCMGGSLRLCKEKFYPGVHDALRTWVSAAADDGWAVRDVRYGPPPAESAASRGVSPAKKANNNNNNGGIKLNNNHDRRDDLLPPRLEMPRLSLGLDTTPAAPSVVPTSITPHSPRVNNNNNNHEWLS